MGNFTGLLAIITLAISFITVNSQITTPCTVSMIASFTPCVNFITGSSNGRSPNAGCCAAVESMMTTSSQCMCLIVTGNVPVSLPSPINQALAITLPKACNSKSVPLQCKSTGVPLPPAGPALFVPPPPKIPPPQAFPPTADSPDLPPSPSGSETSQLAPTPTPSENDPNDLPGPDAPLASAPISQHGQTVGSGIRPVLTPASSSNPLMVSHPVLLLTLVAITVTNFREVFNFRCIL